MWGNIKVLQMDFSIEVGYSDFNLCNRPVILDNLVIYNLTVY